MEFIFWGKSTEKDSVKLALRASFRIRIIIWLVGIFMVLSAIVSKNFIWAIVGVLYVGGLEYYLRFRAKRLYRSNALNQENYKISFSEHALKTQSNIGEAELKPEQIYKIKVSEDYADIYLSKAQVMLVKKEQLQSGEWTDFVSMLKESWIKK